MIHSQFIRTAIFSAFLGLAWSAQAAEPAVAAASAAAPASAASGGHRHHHRTDVKAHAAEHVASGAHAAHAMHHAHWEYVNAHETGPGHWGDLDHAFEECSKGVHQSPVNIDKTVKAALPALEFSYSSIAPVILNNGHTVQVNLPSGQKLKVGDQSYELLQFHFHTPSEEAISNKHAPMVAHFVHKNADGKLGVVALLIDIGKEPSALDAVFDHLPRPGEKITVDDLSLDLAAALPKGLGYYNLEGSLTTPPCSEGVNWMILKEHATLTRAHVRAFQHIFHANARPTQPVNDRVIKESL
ncbi:MAG: carbonic anhydrase [Leptothrix ochracea]|uniref:carbonic anhydrase n=1 Tax=Leptothrix ochracea TaxID=735331 RepID=UPI0034E28B91